MTSETDPEFLKEDEFVGKPPAGDESPEEYTSTNQSRVSDETGVLYEPTGEPETTPHDEEIVEGEEEL